MNDQPAPATDSCQAPDRSPPAPARIAGTLGGEIESILSGISDGLVALDNDWRFTYLNATAARLWKRPAEEIIGRTAFEVLNVDDRNPFNQKYLASKQSGEPVVFTAYSVNFGRWLEVHGYPHPGGYTILFRDVSQERCNSHESDQRREATHAINQRIFETSLDLILVVDSKGNFMRVSPSCAAILGYEAGELIGRNAIDFVYRDDLDNTRNEMRLARRGRVMRNFECRYVHKDGRVVTLAWTGVWSEPEQQHFFIGRDMTERIRLEQQLRQAQKMEAIGQLTGGVAHDFNNILTTIIGMAEMLGGALADDPRLRAIVQTIDEAAERGAQLTRRMLSFARKQPLQ